MEECQAVVTRIPLPLLLPWHCSPRHCCRRRCCSVASIGAPHRSGEKQFQQYCDTGTSGQRRSDGNIELVRFLDIHEGDGPRAVSTGVQLLYRNNTPHDDRFKFAHRYGIHSE